MRTYISEPDRGRRNWKNKEAEKYAVYGNRRRIRGRRGRELQRRRGEKVERTSHLRGHENIRKRLLIHVAGFNLGLLLRRMYGFGTPRALQGFVLASEKGTRVILDWLKDFLAAEIAKTEQWSPESQIRAVALIRLIETRFHGKSTFTPAC